MQHLTYARVLVGLFIMTCYLPIMTGPLGPLPTQVPSKVPAAQDSAEPEVSIPIAETSQEITPITVPTAVPTAMAAGNVIAAIPEWHKTHRPWFTKTSKRKVLGGQRSR
jgi:hypothetical protein